MDRCSRQFKYVLVLSSLRFNERYSKIVSSERDSTDDMTAIRTLERYADYYYVINN